ncbi:MAG TPA: methionine biosynthesis protein MetW [Armatimonadota bacterium]|nr:methionine biosynthesis protein MetW [Armatimonadota bacterium]HQK94343.1 methionine biosynthesis protein MetW [Armatimonadota bacterium]
MNENPPILSLGDASELAALIRDKVDPALMGLSAGKLTEYLNHVGSSQPRTPGPDAGRLQRWQDDIIESTVPQGCSILDLGCGHGDLLVRLMDRKQVRGQGIELDPDAVIQCVRQGVPVVQADLDEGLKDFADESFDYAVLEQTLQTVRRPIALLQEMLRVARRGIVSFPNFAYWRVRLDLGLRGRMPITERLPYRWYDTPNIHSFTLQDFEDWTRTCGVRILSGHVLAEGQVRELRASDNLYAEEVLVFVERE